MKSRKRSSLNPQSPLALMLVGITSLALTGCFLSEDSKPNPGKETGPKPLATVASCQDLSPAQKAEADALVKAGSAELVQEITYMADTAESWGDVHAKNTDKALSYYNQALTAAPGHCGALFGKAIASAINITQEKELDTFIRKIDSAGSVSTDENSLARTALRLAKLTPDQAPSVLLKTSSKMALMPPVTVQEAQALVENVILPKTDSTIAYLETILNYPGFSFEVEAEGEIRQFDLGEVGPMLAGLKVFKSFLLVVVGYNWDPSLDGTYDWVETMEDIDQSSFDNLTAQQKAALDHLTGLFKTGNNFTKQKPAWKSAVRGIPDLLLSGVEDAQKGLRYAISEAGTSSQSNDLYVVGTGPDADVDPADLEDAVEALERSKKYLKGEVSFNYNLGRSDLKVNFRKIFEVDGIQSQLPYFKFYPYAEWNDTLSADTSWGSYSGSHFNREILSQLGYSAKDYRVNVGYNYSNPSSSTQYVTAMDFTEFGGKVDTLARLTQVAGNPCAFQYEKFLSRVSDGEDEYGDPAYSSIPGSGSGTVTGAGCRVVNGITEYIEFVDAVVRGPIYFTDPSGNKTVGVDELEKYGDDISLLANKIYFQDPTFSGILPEQTQTSIWTTIKSMETIEPRVRRRCVDSVDPVTGVYNYNCTTTMPNNPSDLDYMMKALYFQDDML